MWVEQRMEKTDKQTRMHACMRMPLVSSIKRQRVRVCVCKRGVCVCVRKCMRAPAHLRLWAHPNGMITNPQTHQRGLEKKKKEGAHKKRENAKLKYSAPSEEKIKQAWFSSPEKEKGREEKKRDRNRHRIRDRPQISEHKRETAQGQENIKDRERNS